MMKWLQRLITKCFRSTDGTPTLHSFLSRCTAFAFLIHEWPHVSALNIRHESLYTLPRQQESFAFDIRIGQTVAETTFCSFMRLTVCRIKTMGIDDLTYLKCWLRYRSFMHFKQFASPLQPLKNTRISFILLTRFPENVYRDPTGYTCILIQVLALRGAGDKTLSETIWS